MKINRDRLLAFYDKRQEWPAETGSPVSAVTGVMGEDLVLGLLCHYLGGKILTYRCKPSGRSGAWLDAWVSAGKQLYQVEVKNWSAHSAGGLKVPSDLTGLRNVAQRNLINFFTKSKPPERIWKVLGEMSLPPEAGTAKPIPVLAFWAPVAEQKSNSANLPWCFECKVSDFLNAVPERYQNTPHRKIQIFSASLYLRSMRGNNLNVPMPRAEARLQELGKLLE